MRTATTNPRHCDTNSHASGRPRGCLDHPEGSQDKWKAYLKALSRYYMWISRPSMVHATFKIHTCTKAMSGVPKQSIAALKNPGLYFSASPRHQAKLPERPPDSSKARTVRRVHHQVRYFYTREPTFTVRVIICRPHIIILIYPPTGYLAPHPVSAPACSSGLAAPFPSARSVTSEPAHSD